MKPILGSIVALITPMLDSTEHRAENKTPEVDYAGLRHLIDWHIEQGTDCIGVVGTTGESPTVSVEEHWEILRVAVEHAAGRVPIMAGTGANSTAEAIEHSSYAKKLVPTARCRSCRTTTSPRKKAFISTSKLSPKPSMYR